MSKVKQGYERDIESLETDHTVEAASEGQGLCRVIWGHDESIRAHTLDNFGIGVKGDYPALRAISVTSDPTYWYNELADEYPKNKVAHEIEIYPIPGDVVLTPTDSYASAERSQILITSRVTLREGVDFDYIREFAQEEEEDFDEEAEPWSDPYADDEDYD